MLIPVSTIHYIFVGSSGYNDISFDHYGKNTLTRIVFYFNVKCNCYSKYEPTTKNIHVVNHFTTTFVLGYQGNGVTCTWVGLCNVNNGGCHSLATCQESPGLSLY